VQTGGERFERRLVRTGLRDGEYVGIEDGLALGERVVSRGAYLAHLAAAPRRTPATATRTEGADMIADLIRWSLKDRLFVLAAAVLLLGYGIHRAIEMPVDVFPDLTAPTVTVLAEAPGLAPTEMETLVTIPIETALNGAAGVRRIRSSTAIGSAIVWVEFDWGAEIYRARQIVAEKLQTARASLPPEVPSPVLAPVTSIMGEVMYVALRSEGGADQHDLMTLKTLADWTLRRQLLAVPGVAQVIPTGGRHANTRCCSTR